MDTCGWLVEDNTFPAMPEGLTGEEADDWAEAAFEAFVLGPVVRDCGAEVTFTERGWSCKAGHAHVYAEVRHNEGWDYAHDEIEAGLLARAGVDSVGMDGVPF